MLFVWKKAESWMSMLFFVWKKAESWMSMLFAWKYSNH
ncbi:MAG: hypothetical protein ACI9CB_002090 [Rhodothermales bacterium]|jgi:hypothetical protein